MKYGLLLAALLCLATPVYAQNVVDEFDKDPVQVNQAAVVDCSRNFSEDSLVRLVTTYRIADQGFAALDSEWIHAFAKEYYDLSCAAADCHDAVVQVRVCSELVSHIHVPY
jgi:hypothetical protein